MVELTHYKLDSQYFVHMENRDRILSATVSSDENELTSPVNIENTIPDGAEKVDQEDIPKVVQDKFAPTVVFGSSEDSIRHKRSVDYD